MPSESSDDVVTSEDVSSARSETTRSRRKVFVEWAVILVVAVTASFLIRTYAVQTFVIPSKSMNPTLHVGDRILVNKLSVEFGSINVGDVIVFKAPPREHCNDEGIADLVKRVIGLPGQHLTSKGNTIYVNGQALKEPWTYFPTIGTPIGHVTVPPGSYFVMGDNRADSCDSRFWGTVPRSDIIGKVFLRVWPPSRIGFI
jgi:signal peptidase I